MAVILTVSKSKIINVLVIDSEGFKHRKFYTPDTNIENILEEEVKLKALESWTKEVIEDYKNSNSFLD